MGCSSRSRCTSRCSCKYSVIAIVSLVLLFIASTYFSQFKYYPDSSRDRQHDEHYTDHYNTMSDKSENKTFVYYVGQDSIANDILLVKKAIPELKEKCRATHNCVGFNSGGYLKNKILPYNKWSNNTNNGLYILDKDYCGMGWHSCSDDTICVNQYNGKYICNNKIPMDEDTIHIVMSVDIHLLEGIVPLITSIQQHNPINEIIIHIVVGKENRSLIKSTINCSIQTQENVQILFVNFEVPYSFQQLIRVERHPYLASTANFARFFFDKIFSSLTHVLYFDVDTIVLHDMKSLWKQLITLNEHLLLIVPREYPKYKIHFTNPNFTVLYQKRYNETINMSSYSFNGGIIGFNLDKWRRDNITREVIYWMKENFKNPLWFQGTQPVLYIIGFNNWKCADKRWNVDGLGWTNVPVNAVKSAYILHWNGPYKPWGNILSMDANIGQHLLLLLKRYDYIWKKYNRRKCNNNGICQKENNEGYSTCKCTNGYEGRLCEKHVNS